MFSEATCATLAVTKLRLAANKVPHRRQQSATSTGNKSHIGNDEVVRRRERRRNIFTLTRFRRRSFLPFSQKHLTTSPNTPQSPIHKRFKASEVSFKHLTNTSLTLTWVKMTQGRPVASEVSGNSQVSLFRELPSRNPFVHRGLGPVEVGVRSFCVMPSSWRRRRHLLVVYVALGGRRCGTLLASMWHFVGVEA